MLAITPPLPPTKKPRRKAGHQIPHKLLTRFLSARRFAAGIPAARRGITYHTNSCTALSLLIHHPEREAVVEILHKLGWLLTVNAEAIIDISRRFQYFRDN